MSEPVMIGILEVYNGVTELKGQVAQLSQQTAVHSAVTEQRVTALEKQAESERARRWALYVALIGVAVAIAMGVLAIVTR